jgi:hypothetical protein
MSDNDDIRNLLLEIRDNQRRSLELQETRIEIANTQLERSRLQVDESLSLQREAIAKQKTITRIAVPGIALCIAAIIYLIVRYL